MTLETLMRALLHRAIALGVLLGVGACATHEVEPAFRASVLIDDRGISVPLPPPSLVDEPQQDVEVQGEVVGLEGDASGLVVRILDNVSGSELEATLDADDMFRVEGLGIDLTDNCIEAWLEDDGGAEGQHRRFEASISASGQEVEVVEVDGC